MLLFLLISVAFAGTKMACANRDQKFRCPSFVSFQDSLSKATDVLRFTFNQAGTDTDGTWVWKSPAFAAGGKLDDDTAVRKSTCTVDINEVRMINKRRSEDASCNDPQPADGQQLVLSGQCQGSIFYGVPFFLGFSAP